MIGNGMDRLRKVCKFNFLKMIKISKIMERKSANLGWWNQ